MDGFKYGLKKGPWKYIVADEEGTEELYHLREDPGELKDRRDDDPETRDRMAKELDAFRKQVENVSVFKKQKTSAEDDERFRTLGYVK